MPTPTTREALARASNWSFCQRAVTRTRPAGVTTCRSMEGKPCFRGVRRGSTPGRTVAIWMGESERIAATSRPPKAGFQQTNRRSRSSSSMASPVSPEPVLAAMREATSRPHDVLGARMH